ncbi:MAG: carboxymuconolactone decarboxylase family protein [Corynebacterium sp.]|nr:carboxymuconolactone decarboxylase family protein [Corynebacterium sp.]
MTDQKSPVGPQLDRELRDVFLAQGKVAALLSEKYAEVDLSEEIVELAMVHASQLNGCAACLAVHMPAARKAGVSQEKLDILPAWREVDVFDAQEKAALELCEALTLLPRGKRLADAPVQAAEHFTDGQLATLEWAIIMINTYNRISIASGHGPN